MKKISIMVIDDHTLIRESWISLLATMENLEIVGECGDGSLAIELAKKMRPEIVLLDINMLPIDGFQVLKMIRRFSPISKVIGVSMRYEPAYVKKFMRLGARGYVTKNSPRVEMADAINEVSIGNTYICREVKMILSQQLLEGGDRTPDISSLTESELQILPLLSGGLSSKEVAGKLGIALKTVDVHRHNILKKMDQKNIASLIRYVNSRAIEI
jgi:two-component system invasion response regulator UvrY